MYNFRNLFLTALLSVVLNLAQSQDCQSIFEDFESQRNIQAYQAFGGLSISQGKVNPSKDIINNSDSVALLKLSHNSYESLVMTTEEIKNADVLKWGSVYFSVDVLAKSSANLKLILRKNGAGELEYPLGRHTEFSGKYSTPNQWETVYFKVADNYVPDKMIYGDSIKELEILPVAGADTLYFDNVKITNYYSIDNFDSERNNNVLSFDGNFLQEYENDIESSSGFYLTNSSTKYGLYQKKAGNVNSGILYASNGIIPGDLLSGKSKFEIWCTGSASQTVLRITLINRDLYNASTGSGIHSVYEAKSTGFFSFDLVKEVTSNILDVEVDGILLQISPGTSSTTAFKLDNFIVKDIIDFSAKTIIGSSSACIGANSYRYLIENEPNTQYQWITSLATIDGNSMGNSVNVNFNAPNKYPYSEIIQVITQKQGFCPNPPFVKHVQIDSTPQLTLSTVDQTVCEGSELILSSTFSGSNGVKWTKTGGTGTFPLGDTIANAKYSFSVDDIASGFLQFKVQTVGGNCGTKSANKLVTFLPLPRIDLPKDTFVCEPNESITLTATANFDTDLNWFGGHSFDKSNPVPSGTPVTYILTSHEKNLDKFSLNIQTYYGYLCGNLNEKIDISYLSSSDPKCNVTGKVHEIMTSKISIYPSPSNDGNFKLDGLDGEEIKVEIMDAFGRTERFDSNEFRTNLSGLLIVNVTTRTEFKTFKVISSN